MGVKYSTEEISKRAVCEFESPEAAARANADAELFALHAAIDEFAVQMKRKAHAQYAKGRQGWDRPDGWVNPSSVDGDYCESEGAAVHSIRQQLYKHAHKADPVDCGLFAMFWWNMDDKESAVQGGES